ncbi:MAG: hypothetical protein AAF564_05115 [Bacteroidota bacterium]
MSRRIRHITLLLLCFAGFVVDGFVVNCMAQQSNEAVIRDIKGAYESLDFSVAEARIEAALEGFDRFTPAELGEIYTVYALILFTRNDQAGTRKQLALALQVNPALQLSPQDTPPQVIDILDELITLRNTASPAETELRYLVIEDVRPAAVMRSMILPGWGQLHKNERTKGIALMSAWGVSAAGALLSHTRRQQAEEDYLAALTPADIEDRYSTFNQWHKTRNNLIVAAAGIWVFSYVDALLKRPAAGKQSPVRLTYTPAPNQHNLTLRYSF